MKPRENKAALDRDRVAPRAGAWIETLERDDYLMGFLVAPRAGAWIETALYHAMWLPSPCRPPRGGVD